MAAESIGISSLDENVAQALAGDVEFRLHQVIEVRLPCWQLSGPRALIHVLTDLEMALRTGSACLQEAQKFMRHSKRTTMTPSDINHALASLNIEVPPPLPLL